MSEALTAMCSVLLREYFGDIVEKVGTFLMKQVVSSPLIVIFQNVSLPKSKIKSSLCVLIQHNLCDFSEDERGFVQYKLKVEYVTRLLHYEKYAYSAQMLFGTSADLLVEEVLNHGKLTMSESIQKVVERLQDAKDATGVDYSSENVCNKFQLLIENHYLMRCSYPHSTDSKKIPNLEISEEEKFVVPEIKLHLLEVNTTDEPESKRQKIVYPDDGIYWRINFDRFQQYFRDEAIISACQTQYGSKAAEVVKAILSESDPKANILTSTTSSVQYHDIARAVIDNGPILAHELDSLLAVLCEGGTFISKSDDRGNGMYVVNFTKILQKIVEDTAASVVQDGFGSKCARVFRILLAKKVLDPKQIEGLAMLHPKDTKEHIFKMIKENYIIPHELSKSADFSQSIYFLRIDMPQVCRLILERCYQGILNLISSSEAQYQDNKRLLEKKQRIDAIVASLRLHGSEEDQIEEVQQIISKAEETVINKVNLLTQKIDSSQTQLAEMISTLSIWLDYNKIK